LDIKNNKIYKKFKSHYGLGENFIGESVDLGLKIFISDIAVVKQGAREENP